MLPSTSIAKEKETKTLQVLAATPASLKEVMLAKGIFGFLLSLFMGLLMLAVNRAFGSQPALLVLIMALGAIMASELGCFWGYMQKIFQRYLPYGNLQASSCLVLPSFTYFPKSPSGWACCFPPTISPSH